MRHLDLFSGIGGFALAATWVWGGEYENVGHSEIEPYPCKVYHGHFPESECLGDITKINWKEGQADLITGGFPCQPHSVAGRRKGSEDSRDLWHECIRALCGVRPRYAVFENVPGLITSDRGRFFNRVLRDIHEGGYDAEWQIVSAQAVGAPHKRERVWIVAYASDSRYRQLLQPQRISGREEQTDLGGNGKVRSLADSYRQRSQGRNDKELPECTDQRFVGQSCSSIRDSSIAGLPDWSGGEVGQPRPITEFERPGGREVERDFRGISHGVSHRVDRLKALGNAIVPQCARIILEAIKQYDRT